MGAVEQLPQAAESKGRQQEHFKEKKFDFLSFQQVLNY